jgi:hypothetical protein
MKGSKKQKTYTREEIAAAIYTARHTAKTANEMQTIDLLAEKDDEISVAELDRLTKAINGLLDSAFDLLIKIIDEES